MDIANSNKIVEWPIKLTHEFHHQRMCDNMFECLSEFALSTQDIKDLPRIAVDNSPDYSRICVSDFFMWFAQNAKKPTHLEV